MPDGTTAEPQLREASAADVDWLLELRMATMADYLEQSGVALSRGEQRERVVQAFDAIRIVCLDGTDIGMMKVVREPDLWHLVQIQLLPAHQRGGIGRRLISQLLADAGRAGVPVSLQVLKVNPAKRLYERLGFQVVADRGHSYDMRTRS